MAKSIWQLALAVSVPVFSAACSSSSAPERTRGDESAVGGATLSARLDRIKTISAQSGITNALLVAGIGYQESGGLNQCWVEAQWSCPGPASSDCGGGAVVAGSGDPGGCPAQQGGIGMFQLDNGTYAQTLAYYGSGILTVDGNITAGVKVILDKIWISTNTPYFPNMDAEKAWINGIRPGTADFDTWLTAITEYYNGCFPGQCSAFDNNRAAYRDKTMALYDMMGDAYWYGGSGGGGGGSPPAVPAGLAPSGGTLTDAPVNLTWNGVPGATSYVVNVLHNSGSWVNDVIDAKTTQASFALTPPVNGVTYAWKARACNDAGCSADTDWVYFAFNATSATKPAVPSGLSPNGGTITTPVVDFAWSPSPGASSYVLNVLHWDGSLWQTDLVGYTLPGTLAPVQLAANTSYVFRVHACNAAGCSDDSSWAEFAFAAP